VKSRAFSATYVVEHPVFGEVLFVFDNQHAGGFAATDGFVFFGVKYPPASSTASRAKCSTIVG
jgi:hypothetical protein